jgi:3-oxoacyl-[acyl-carrier-protein] synthase-3
MSRIVAISSYLPKALLTNHDLALRFPSWSPQKIYSKTGILQRHIASSDETAADLAIQAAKNLFADTTHRLDTVDMLLLVTQTPDQSLPSTACRIHHELGLPRHCGAIDLNQGCSGYIYGLAMADGLITAGTAKTVLLLTADTYSKLINPLDRSVATLFGDGATATLIDSSVTASSGSIGPTLFGTDGSGANSLYCNFGGWRNTDIGDRFLYMDGPAIMSFTLSVVAESLMDYLRVTGNTLDSYQHFVFHQANRFILEKLYSKLGILQKGIISMELTGNTVSSTIPLALEKLIKKDHRRPCEKVLLSGYGVGLSWGSTTIVI